MKKVNSLNGVNKGFTQRDNGYSETTINTVVNFVSFVPLCETSTK